MSKRLYTSRALAKTIRKVAQTLSLLTWWLHDVAFDTEKSAVRAHLVRRLEVQAKAREARMTILDERARMLARYNEALEANNEQVLALNREIQGIQREYESNY